jgi:hypothetical protein
VVQQSGATKWCNKVVQQSGATKWCNNVVQQSGATKWCNKVGATKWCNQHAIRNRANNAFPRENQKTRENHRK